MFIKNSTVNLVCVYKKINPLFKYDYKLKNFGEILTKDTEPYQNLGMDNFKGDYICSVGDVIASSLSNHKSHSYVVESILGEGVYGQVFRCCCSEDLQTYAVKVIKNSPGYRQQAFVEKQLLKDLKDADPSDALHTLRIVESFIFKSHFCIVTDIGGDSLVQILQKVDFSGLNISLIGKIAKQIISCLCLLQDMTLKHADIKPDNILVKSRRENLFDDVGSIDVIDACDDVDIDVRLIDFGNATYAQQRVNRYLQSLYYRAPEVVLGCSFDTRIDVWSLGCLLVELCVGRPLFPAATEHDLLTRITAMLGPLPDELLDRGSKTRRFFHEAKKRPLFKFSFFPFPNKTKRKTASTSRYTLLSYEEYVCGTVQNKAEEKEHVNDDKVADRRPRKYNYIGATIEETIIRQYQLCRQRAAAKKTKAKAKAMEEKEEKNQGMSQGHYQVHHQEQKKCVFAPISVPPSRTSLDNIEADTDTDTHPDTNRHTDIDTDTSGLWADPAHRSAWRSLLQLVRMCLVPDPAQRITARQCMLHPFVRGKPYNAHWVPPVDETMGKQIIVPVSHGGVKVPCAPTPVPPHLLLKLQAHAQTQTQTQTQPKTQTQTEQTEQTKSEKTLARSETLAQTGAQAQSWTQTPPQTLTQTQTQTQAQTQTPIQAKERTQTETQTLSSIPHFTMPPSFFSSSSSLPHLYPCPSLAWDRGFVLYGDIIRSISSHSLGIYDNIQKMPGLSLFLSHSSSRCSSSPTSSSLSPSSSPLTSPSASSPSLRIIPPPFPPPSSQWTEVLVNAAGMGLLTNAEV